MNVALRRRPVTPIPPDVRWMNRLSLLLVTAAVVGALALVVLWLLQRPVFALTRITVVGDVVHNNPVTVRANVAPRLLGNFYTLDLLQARAVFESLPWVRRAVVRREFPNRLRVTLQEHQAVAYWGDADEPRLLNQQGEVFEANVDEVDRDDLPRLNGPDTQSAQVLAMYRRLDTEVQALDMVLESLELSARGGWRAHLDNEAVLELGTGADDDIVLRLRRFVQTFAQVGGKYGRRADALLSADLRYPTGYAVRLRGVGTVSAETPVGPKK